jgi:hypothetical protein
LDVTNVISGLGGLVLKVFLDDDDVGKGPPGDVTDVIDGGLLENPKGLGDL